MIDFSGACPMKTVLVSCAFLCILAVMGNGQTVLQQFNGLAAGDYFGSAVAGAGDVNRDGFADIVVGAGWADPGGRMQAGQATVFSGKDGSVLYTFNGLVSNDCFGGSVAGAGDVNRDGHADIVVGAAAASPRGSTMAGQATVFSGKDGSVLYTFNGLATGDNLGSSVAGAGDVNRDGFPDIVVGAANASPLGRTMAGQATVFSGKDGSVLYTFNGLVTRDFLGVSAAGAGDANRDGFPDIIVGAYGASPGWRKMAGQATVFSGKDGRVLYTFNGLATGDGFGYSVAGAGDINKDGFSDLVAGAAGACPGGRRYAGQATVFSGQDGSVLYTFDGVVACDFLGISVDGAGDVNRDGFPDVVVGAWGASAGGLSGAGQAIVFSGKDGKILHTLNGAAMGDAFGWSVAAAGHVDRDGVPDLVVGADLAAPGGNALAGQATVISVASTSISGSGSSSIGGTIALFLLSRCDGNLPYQVGTSLGTGPIPVDTRLLNLSPDAILFLSVGGAAPAVFQDYCGNLDSAGNGKAALKIPKASALVGYRIHSAFVTLDASSPSHIKSISNTFSFVITT